MTPKLMAALAASSLVLALPAVTAEAAPQAAAKVSVKVAKVAIVGKKTKVSGSVPGSVSTGATVKVMLKAAGSKKFTVAGKTKVTAKHTYKTKVKVTALGAAKVRVVVTSKGKRLTSPTTSITGMMWLDLTKQTGSKEGPVKKGPVTIAGKKYKPAFTFSGSGIYFGLDGKCDIFAGSVGIPDGDSGSATLIVIGDQDDFFNPMIAKSVTSGSKPTAVRTTKIKGMEHLSFGYGDGNSDHVAVVAPRVRCSVATLPEFAPDI